MKFFIPLIICGLYSHFTQGHFNKRLSRLNAEGILYQDPDPRSKSLLFSKTLHKAEGLGAWKNLSNIAIQYGLKSKSLFCGLGQGGGWLAYREENFKVGNSMSLQILIGETCVHATKIKSLQPLGPINRNLASPTSSGLLTFKSIYFTSEYQLIKSNEEIIADQIKSLIHTGPNKWTIEGYIQTRNGSMMLSSKPICLMGVPRSKIIFCTVPDIDHLLEEEGQKFDKVVIRRGCEQNNTVVGMQHCYSEGTFRIMVEGEMPKPLSSCKKYLKPIEERKVLEYSEILQIWELRMNKNKIHFQTSQNSQAKIQTMISLDKNSHKPHLHQTFTTIMNQLVPNFALFCKSKCADASLEYVNVLGHLMKTILNSIFMLKANYTEKLKFVELISEFEKSLRSCKRNSTTPYKIQVNETQMTQCNFANKTFQPFVQLFPNVISLLSKNCFPDFKFPFEELNKELFQFLNNAYLNWNMIYEYGLNGLNVGEQEQLILKCLKLDQRKLDDLDNVILSTTSEKVNNTSFNFTKEEKIILTTQVISTTEKVDNITFTNIN